MSKKPSARLHRGGVGEGGVRGGGGSGQGESGEKRWPPSLAVAASESKTAPGASIAAPYASAKTVGTLLSSPATPEAVASASYSAGATAEASSTSRSGEEEDEESHGEADDAKIPAAGDSGPRYNLNDSRRDEGRWIERCEELQAYLSSVGNCNVPQRYPQNPALARWVNLQRVEYKKLHAGEFSSMTRERVGALDALGFEWDTLDAAWSRRFEELTAFKAEKGHCNVPLRHAANPALGRWVVRQRHERRLLYEGKPSQLTKAREEALDSLGFVWDVGESLWNRRLDELRQYRDEHDGSTDVPYFYPPNRRLGHWVRNQRTQYALKKAGKKSRLGDERLEALENIGFAWTGSALASDRAATGSATASDRKPAAAAPAAATSEMIAEAAVSSSEAMLICSPSLNPAGATQRYDNDDDNDDGDDREDYDDDDDDDDDDGGGGGGDDA